MIEYTLSPDEAMTLLARALSMKHDRTEPYYHVRTVMRVVKGRAELVEINFQFYGERQSGLQNPQPARAVSGDSSDTPESSLQH